MLLGQQYGNFRESSLDFLRQLGTNRVFCVKMPGIDQIKPQGLGIPELVVLHITGDKGIAAGTKRFIQSIGTGTAAYSDPAHGLAAVCIPQTGAAPPTSGPFWTV